MATYSQLEIERRRRQVRQALSELELMADNEQAQIEIIEFAAELLKKSEGGTKSLEQVKNGLNTNVVERMARCGFTLALDEQGRVVIKDEDRGTTHPIHVAEALNKALPADFDHVISVISQQNRAYIYASRLIKLD